MKQGVGWAGLLGPGLALVACGAPQAMGGADGSGLSAQAPGAPATPGMPVTLLGAPGSVDTAYGSSGRVTLEADGRNVRPTALRVLSGGKLLVGGFAFYSSQGTDFALARLLPGGAPDPSWNGGETVATQVVRKDYLHGLDVQPDGKVVAVGSASFVTTHVDRQIALVRYTPSGALDASFGAGGTVLLNFAADDTVNEEGWGVKVLASGKLLVAGASDGKLFVARLLSSGALDAGFGVGGKVFVDPGVDITPFAVAFRNGAVVLAGIPQLTGPASGTVTLARVFNSGSLDANFGAGGLANISFPERVQGGAIAIQSDDRVLLAANLLADSGPSDRAHIVRVREDGTKDPTFGVGGAITQPFGLASGSVQDLKIQEDDDKILAAGDPGIVGPDDTERGYALARFKLNGKPDAGFGTAGVVRLKGEMTYGERLAFTAGRILMAGSKMTLSPKTVRIQVLRFFR